MVPRKKKRKSGTPKGSKTCDDCGLKIYFNQSDRDIVNRCPKISCEGSLEDPTE